IKKDRAQQVVRQEFDRATSFFASEADTQVEAAGDYALAIAWEVEFERAHRRVLESGGLRRLVRQAQFWTTRRRASRQAARTTDVLAESVGQRRARLQDIALDTLRLGRELAVSAASREERSGLRELASVLKRDQARFKNFSMFDRMKSSPE